MPKAGCSSTYMRHRQTTTKYHWILLVLQMTLMISAYAQDATVNSRNDTVQENQCQLIQVPMCKGLIAYNATRLPNRFGHTTQTEVYWALQPWWPFIDSGCSDNLRNFLCGLYLPRCAGNNSEPHYPCQETCKKAKVRCQKTMRQQHVRWGSDFKCITLLPKTSKQCVKPERERKKKQHKEYVLCEVNKLPMCQGIPFPQGSLPNMFLQADKSEIDAEMRQFQPLLDSGCSRKLRLFMCGVFMPFCVPGSHVDENGDRQEGSNNLVINRQPDVPFVVPCRELCQEIQDQCSAEYKQKTHGLPWPAKFHCHRFPSYADHYISNGTLGKNANKAGRPGRRGTSVPCTMPPYNYHGN
ncbi:hypothetical protein BsWGS_23750 [Bradybaena similaris]